MPSEHKTALLLAPTFEESLQDVMDLRLNAAQDCSLWTAM
jgi:hypothetical protein